jgi:GxxExxY protein
MNIELIYKEESYKILGACFEVYREKGCGFVEPVYQECMEIELRLQGVPFVAQRPLGLEYKKCPLRSTYQPDFVCFDKIILELKAVTELTEENRAQVQNYLKATGFKLGLLVNLGHYSTTFSQDVRRFWPPVVLPLPRIRRIPRLPFPAFRFWPAFLDALRLKPLSSGSSSIPSRAFLR